MSRRNARPRAPYSVLIFDVFARRSARPASTPQKMPTCSNCKSDFSSDYKFCPKCGTMIAPAGASTTALEGRTLSGKYRLLSRVGEGAMGTVYLAEHTALQKRVAVKVLHPDLQMNDELIRRFQLEGIAAGKFSHPNAIQIFDFDRGEGDLFYLAMEYVEGKSLKSLIKDRGALLPQEAIDVMRQVLSALAEAHKQGIVHRDLKPENIMVVPDAAGGLAVKILDFGISKLRDLRSGDTLLTQTGRIMGTPLYMAPEQFTGESVDHRADIYAAGLILYELLSGEPPFTGDSVSQILFKKAVEEPRAITETRAGASIPKDLERVIRCAMERQPADRFQNATEMIEALLGLKPVRRAAPRIAAGGNGARRSPLRVASLLVGVAALVAAAIFVVPKLLDGGLGPSAKKATRLSQRAAAERSETEERYVSLLASAREALRARDLDSALGQAEKAAMMECRDSEAYLVRGLVQLRRGDLETAKADVGEALRLDPDYADAASASGWIEIARRDGAAAKSAFDRALASDPRHVDALTGLGAAALEARDPDAAAAHLEKAIGIDATSAPAHLWLGRARVAQGKLDLAAESFLHAKRHDSRLADAYFELGRVSEEQEKFEAAERSYRDTIGVDPERLDARIGLATALLKLDRIADAESQLQDIVRRHPESARGHVLMAVAHQKLGRADDAVAELRRGVGLDRRDVEARVLLGILLQSRGEHGAAIEQYEAALEIDGGVAVAHQNIGLCEFARGDHEAAREALLAAIGLDDDLVEAHYALGILNMEYFDDAGEAALHFRRYQELGGPDPRVSDWLKRL